MRPVGRSPVRRDGGRRGVALLEALLALALVAAAVLLAGAGLRGERRLLHRAEERNAVARQLEAALESVRSGVLPLRNGAFVPPVPSGPDGLSIRIEVSRAGRGGLYRVAAIACWGGRERRLRQRLDTMVWRP